MLKLSSSQLPTELKNLPQPPKEMYVEGRSLEDLLKYPRIAIVGSRKPTSYGRSVTMQLTAALASRGVVIISGLAFGIDAIAHEACLKAGGITAAILPGSLLDIYPTSNLRLAEEIIRNGGSLLSEHSTSSKPFKYQFIARNRLIAALSDAVIIPEAAENSGSLHTANFALEMGKPVLAVPGNITSPMSQGTNNLIKAGATPLTSAKDILDALNWQLPKTISKKTASNSEEETILGLIEQGVTEGSDLLARSKLEPQLFNQTLTMLEITGRIRPSGGNHWSF